jgi:putative spermidine/putrescine transport system substrate-binding protein
MTDHRTASRRSILKGAGLAATGLAAPFVFTGNRAFAADQFTAADVGGAPGAAIRKAFYDPFEKEMGIKIVGVGHDPDPTVQLKLIADTKSYIWDICMVDEEQVARCTKPKDYLEPLNIPADSPNKLVDGMLTPVWMGFSVFCTVLAYRTDKFPSNGPQTWADYWNVEKFPGRRGLYRGVQGVLEAALMADGVEPHKLYPLDVNRAFKKLDAIKKHVTVWWTSGAQNTQLLQSGEVDLTDTWGGRAYAAIDSGAPVKMSWAQGLYATDGWSILKGTPRADLARKFVQFCMRPETQAAYSSIVANGPSNQKAYDFIKPERASVLPTFPANLKGLAPGDSAWWSANNSKMQERFADWLLS